LEGRGGAQSSINNSRGGNTHGGMGLFDPNEKQGTEKRKTRRLVKPVILKDHKRSLSHKGGGVQRRRGGNGKRGKECLNGGGERRQNQGGIKKSNNKNMGQLGKDAHRCPGKKMLGRRREQRRPKGDRPTHFLNGSGR